MHSLYRQVYASTYIANLPLSPPVYVIITLFESESIENSASSNAPILNPSVGELVGTWQPYTYVYMYTYQLLGSQYIFAWCIAIKYYIGV